MIRRAWPFLLLLLSSPGWGQEENADAASKAGEMPPSLFFTPTEAERLEALYYNKPKVSSTAVPEIAPVEAEPRPNVYLSALVYHGEKDWSAWINGVRFRPGTADKGIRPIKATARWVEMDVDTEAGPTIRVRLAPNQTYVTKTDKVVDGIVP
jgi:hypothetical protein